MARLRPWSGLVVALGMALSGTLTGASAPVTGLAVGGQAAYAGTVPACTATAIDTKKGRLEGAAGSRFQTVRVTNTSGRACATPGWTRYRFLDADGPLGHRSARNPGYDPDASPVVIGAGETARSVLSWVDPGPVPKRKCHPRQATGFRVGISGLPGHYRESLHVKVCTTKKYRPHGTRLTIH